MGIDSGNNERLSVKDLAVLIPIAASTAAIAFEIGTFVHVGGFHYFSLSEHIVAAMRALPQAVGTLATVTFFAANLDEAQGRFDRFLRAANDHPAITAPVLILSFIASGCASLFLGWLTPLMAVGAFLAIAIAFGSNKIHLRSTLGAVTITSVVILLTYGFAADRMLYILSSPAVLPVKLTTKSETLFGKMLMSGERGVLLLRENPEAFVFEKTDEIKSVEWPRSSPPKLR